MASVTEQLSTEFYFILIDSNLNSGCHIGEYMLGDNNPGKSWKGLGLMQFCESPGKTNKETNNLKANRRKKRRGRDLHSGA